MTPSSAKSLHLLAFMMAFILATDRMDEGIYVSAALYVFICVCMAWGFFK